MTTAKDTAVLYVNNIYRWRGVPDSIVSDRGPQFISDFWNEFCRILGVKLKLSTAFHPQTDGQTEIMNQYLDQRLRPFVSYYQDNWSDNSFQSWITPNSRSSMKALERHHSTSYTGIQPELRSTGIALRSRPRLGNALVGMMPKPTFRGSTKPGETARAIMAKSQQKKERDVNRHRSTY